jgi:hypothetical protein
MKSFPQIWQKSPEKNQQNLKYFLLDRRKKGCKLHLQVKNAYGRLTGTRRGRQSGDALFESNERRKLVAITP